MTLAEKLQQISFEYEEGRSFLENKKLRWVDQLKLMNNLNRPTESISSTMLFSYFNRVHSNLYESKLQIKFEPNQDGEISNVQTLNKLALADFQEMNMEMIEYDWTWDACFFARGYCETLNFDKKRKILQPVVLNPLMVGYDPYFPVVDDWRYYWKWITRSGSQINTLIKKKIVTGIKSCTDIESGMDPQVWNYKVLRERARDVNSQGDTSSVPKPQNDVYQILEHYTLFDGVKNVVWTDRAITKILREEPLDLNDDPNNEGESKWPVVTRDIFREPHSSVPLSVPDLVEDKHRAKNVILNLAYIAAKDEATPIFVYKEGSISNPSQLLQRQIMQHISVEEDASTEDSIVPLKKNTALSNSTLSMLNILGDEAASAVGTLQITPPVQKGKKTATGEAIQQQVADLTASLQTKIIGASEKEFWSHWYQRYVNNAKDGDLKLISVTNSQFTTFETIQLKDIKTELPPKAIVFSSRDAVFKETAERRELAQQFGVLQETLPPDRMNMFLKYVWFPKFETFDKETIDLVFPKTQDELKAEMENDMIGKGVLPPISEGDDHEVHLYIHSRVKNSAEKWSHYFAHQKLLSQQQAQAKAAQSIGKNTQGAGNAPTAKQVTSDETAVPAKGNNAAVDNQLEAKTQ